MSKPRHSKPLETYKSEPRGRKTEAPLTNSTPLLNYDSLHFLVTTYTSQYLDTNTPSPALAPEHLVDLEDEYNLLISDCFAQIYEKRLKCDTCSELHRNISIEDALESTRTEMERKPMLEITEDDVEDWERELKGLIAWYWEELGKEGGCPESRPKPGTLVDGKLVLEEWEERIRVEWMRSLFGEGWRDDPSISGKDVEEETGGESLNVGGESVVMTEGYDKIVGAAVERAEDVEDVEEEEEGLAARILRELGMEHYEYKGKEVGRGRVGVKGDDGEREGIAARLLQEFGMENNHHEGEDVGSDVNGREHIDLIADDDIEDDDDDDDGGGIIIEWG